MSEKPVERDKILAVLDKNDHARMKMWLRTCTSCGLCAESCFFYLAHDRDPEYMPQYKVRTTLGELYKRKGNVSREWMEKAKEVIWGRCNMCRRCSQFCPFGIDMALMISAARQALRTQDVCPPTLMTIDEAYLETGNQMSMTAEDFVETCEWMAEEGAENMRDLEIPVDMEGCDSMYTVNAREPKYYPQDLEMAARVFQAAGEKWTFASDGWEATNLSMFSGNMKAATHVARNMFDAARRLGVKRIIMTECGHAYRWSRYESPYWVGTPDGQPPIPVTHAVAVYHDYIKSGKIKIRHKFHEPITYQHPCNLSRNGDLARKGIELLYMLCDDVREMEPKDEYSHCCGGGGGFIPMGPEYKERRMISGKIKAEQIRATGAKFVLAPCHNCTDQINDLGKHYGLGIKVLSFKEVICELMELPEHLKPVEE